VRSGDRGLLLRRLREDAVDAGPEGEAIVRVRGSSEEQIGALAARHGLALPELRRNERSIEAALAPFLEPTPPAVAVQLPSAGREGLTCAV